MISLGAPSLAVSPFVRAHHRGALMLVATLTRVSGRTATLRLSGGGR